MPVTRVPCCKRRSQRHPSVDRSGNQRSRQAKRRGHPRAQPSRINRSKPRGGAPSTPDVAPSTQRRKKSARLAAKRPRAETTQKTKARQKRRRISAPLASKAAEEDPCVICGDPVLDEHEGCVGCEGPLTAPKRKECGWIHSWCLRSLPCVTERFGGDPVDKEKFLATVESSKSRFFCSKCSSSGEPTFTF